MKYLVRLFVLFVLVGSFTSAQNNCVVGHWEYAMGMELLEMSMDSLLQGTDTSLTFVQTDGDWWLDVKESDRGPGEYDALYSFNNFVVSYLLRSPSFAGMGDLGLDIEVSGFQPFDLLADQQLQIVIPSENSLEVKARMPFIDEPLVLDNLPLGFMSADSIDCLDNLFTIRTESPVIDENGNTVWSAITFVRFDN